jgi:UTP--glucose-1-phosphate uridylyltransferase
MLPLVDTPIIQKVVEDAVAAGIEDIIIVTGWSKRSIEDHFDYPFELEQRLQAAGKFAELEKIREIADLANFTYVRQKGPLGNATPIWNCRNVVGDEPFLVLFGDDFIDASPSRATQLVAAHERLGGGTILGSSRSRRPEDLKRYGNASGKEVTPGTLKVDEIIEKPGAGYTASDYAVVSGFVFEPEMFDAIEESMTHLKKDGSNRELVYVDAVNVLLKRGRPVHALEVQNGHYYDCGNKLEYLKAVVEFGLRHEEVGEEFAKYLQRIHP